MSQLLLKASKCIHSLVREGSCNKCETICPTNAITVGNKPLPSIDLSVCVSCGACDAICPNEALSLESFRPTEFLFKFVEEKDKLISCHKNIPCIAALSIEYIISLAILKKEIILDIGHCSECAIANKCKPQIMKNYEEATYLLDAMQSDAKIRVENICFNNEKFVPTNKKDFFNSIGLGNRDCK